MYIRTHERLGQDPMLHGSFADALGASPFKPEIQEFLNQVRKRPQDYKKLLLTVTFHPDPISSQVKITIGKNVPQNLLDVQLMYGIEPPGIFLNKLRRVRDDFQKRDARFRQQIEAELQLRNEMIKTAGDLGPEKLKPFLLEPLFTENLTIFNCRLGFSFAQKMLPPTLVQRIRNSDVSDGHLTNLGKFLRRYGEVLQTKNPAFKTLVERERNRRQQEKQEKERRAREEEEQKRRQQRRRRP